MNKWKRFKNSQNLLNLMKIENLINNFFNGSLLNYKLQSNTCTLKKFILKNKIFKFKIFRMKLSTKKFKLNKHRPFKPSCKKWSICSKNNAKKNHNSCKFASHILPNLSTPILNTMKNNCIKLSKLIILPWLKCKINMKTNL